MSAGAKKARAAAWGSRRAARAQISIDADVAARFEREVSPRDRRRIATGAIYTATEIYVARRKAKANGYI